MNASKFWSRFALHEATGCLVWLGRLERLGYGQVHFGGRLWMVHRLAYTLTYGDIPPGQRVCHKCDNRACGNPVHLFLGSQRDNVRDARDKGRLANSKRTHCPRGHPYDEANTYRLGNRRHCRACGREKALRWYHAHKDLVVKGKGRGLR